MKNTKMLKKNYEYRNVLNKGKYYSGKYIAIFVKKNNKKNNFLGIAISSKLGKAVKRNYAKRIIRENYSQIEENIKKGYDIVFIWRKQQKIEKNCYNFIKKDILKIFKEANMFLGDLNEKNINFLN